MARGPIAVSFADISQEVQPRSLQIYLTLLAQLRLVHQDIGAFPLSQSR
jgi:hypothetical protein